MAYKWVQVPVTPLMLIRCCQQISNGEKIRLKHHWVKLDEGIAPDLALAVVASEDQKFMTHHGFDLDAISFYGQVEDGLEKVLKLTLPF